MEGLQIGSFTLEYPLAVGGMGAVWRAHHRTGVPAAVKIIPADAESTMFEAALGLQAEIRAVGALDHPNIIRVYDAGTLGPEQEAASEGKLRAGSPWLAMELAAGQVDDLERRLDWSLLSSILLQILDGLAHAHARGMVHRDMKPANVLYTETPEGRVRVLLADFGLAWRFRPEDPVVHGGSLPYASPEQILGQQATLGPWTDLYGLGCVAYRLACGKRPFRGRDAEALRKAHLHGERPELEPRFPLPEGFDGWLKGLYAIEAKDRFQRAADAAWSLVRLPPPTSSGPDEEDEFDPPTVSMATEQTATLPLSQWFSADPRSKAVVTEASRVRAPAPEDWRRPKEGKSDLDGRGLGLFGLLDPPMVGRIDERNRLWEELVHHSGARLLALRGPQGIGKSRLAAWLCERAHEVGVAEVFKAEFRQNSTAGAPDGEALAGLVEDHLRVRGLSGADLRRELRGAVRPSEAELRMLVRLLRPDGTEVAPLALTERYALVTDLLQKRANHRRALVWLEDAWWSSEGIGFAEHVLQHFPTAEQADLVVLLTVRDDMVAPAVVRRIRAGIERFGGAELRIAPLQHGQVAELVGALVPARDDLPDRVEKTAHGNPMAAVQLVEQLVKGGHVSGDAGGVYLESGALPVPDDQHWSGVLDQVTGIPGTAASEEFAGLRLALQAAALLGPTVAWAEWREVCRRLQVAVPPAALSRLQEAGLLRAERAGNRYTFADERLHELVLAEARARGPSLALACAEGLAARGPALAGRAAALFEQAELPDRALDAWLDGLGWLVDWDHQRALDAAAAFQALAVQTPPDDPRRGRGLALLVDLHAPEGGDAWRMAVSALERQGRVDKTAALRATIELARRDARDGQHARAQARAELAFKQAKGTPHWTRAVLTRADVRARLGDGPGADEFLQSWVPELDAASEEVVHARTRIAALAGRPEHALRLLSEHVDMQTRAQSPMSRIRTQRLRAWLLAKLGRSREASVAIEEAEATRGRAGIPWPRFTAELAEIRAGRVPPAEGLLD